MHNPAQYLTVSVHSLPLKRLRHPPYQWPDMLGAFLSFKCKGVQVSELSEICMIEILNQFGALGLTSLVLYVAWSTSELRNIYYNWLLTGIFL